MWKIPTRKIPNKDTFNAVIVLTKKTKHKLYVTHMTSKKTHMASIYDSFFSVFGVCEIGMK